MLLNCGVERLLRVPWTARRSNQSILKEISPEYSLEGLMLKLKPILCPPGVKNWLLGKDPDAGKDWGQEEKVTTEDEMVGWHHRLNGQGFGWTLELVTDREVWRAAVHGVAKSRTWLRNWYELNHKWTKTEIYAYWKLLSISAISGTAHAIMMCMQTSLI